MTPFLWSIGRQWVRLRRGRVPPAAMPEAPIWYFAFGSNMNEWLFRERRHMRPIETRIARLDDWRLCFTVSGGRKPGQSAPANIVEAPGETVHGVLYRLPLHKFVRLDASEGPQYEYLWTEVLDTQGRAVPAVTFRVSAGAPQGRPSLAYMRIVREAARQRGLPAGYVDFLDGVETAT